jgi:hypothetical protein
MSFHDFFLGMVVVSNLAFVTVLGGVQIWTQLPVKPVRAKAVRLTTRSSHAPSEVAFRMLSE